MSPPLELDYIGLAEASVDRLRLPPPPSSGAAEEEEEEDEVAPELGLKETELKLGLPGSESPARGMGMGLTLRLIPKGFVSGSKRGFSDAIDGSEGWGFAGGAGSEGEMAKGGGLFSPRGENGGGSHGAGVVNGVKDAVAGAAAGKAVVQEKKVHGGGGGAAAVAPAAKAQVVGWPPIRSYRKNTMATSPSKNKEDAAEGKVGVGCLYIKVSMDGAPYLRKVYLKTYCNYKELSSALEKMFSCFTIGQCGSHGGRDGLNESRLMDLINGSEYVLTYEDKDGDWMLVGDVPWDMFAGSCRRLRIMKGSDAIGLAPRAIEKSKSRN